MSFENKGFKNDLNEAFASMNENHSDEYFEAPTLMTPKIMNFQPIPLKTYQPSGILSTIKAPVMTSVNTSPEKERIGTEANPTGYGEFVIVAKKKKNYKNLYYIIGAVVLLTLLIIYLRKKA
jgi:hypothetical protein